MTKKLYILAITAVAFLASATANAQHLRLPDHGKTEYDKLAYMVAPDFSSSIPSVDFRILPDIDCSLDEMTGDMLDYARGFIGVRYRRGGKTPAGFDCSGFTGYVFRQFGYNLGSSSRDQYNDGVSVSDDDIRPGDLLFFTGRSARSGRVGHVAIALNADGATGEVTFIHASCSGGIRIDKTTDPYYAARYLGARRVVGME